MLSSILIFGPDPEIRLQEIRKIVTSLQNFDENSPDFYLLDQKTAIGIDQIRDIQHYVQFKPLKDEYKIIVIENADLLTHEAQNAFLKTLEEPPDHVLIILSTARRNQLLPTVISRCRQITLSRKEPMVFDRKEFEEYLPIILNGSIGEKFMLAEKMGKDRETVMDFLEKLSLIAGENLTINMINLCRNIMRTRKYIEANVNPRFALENFFLKC